MHMAHGLCFVPGWYLRDQTWLYVYCWCQTPEGVVSPRRAITRAQPEWSPHGETTPTIHTQSCLIQMITWCHHFFPQQPIFCSLKSNLKFELRETAVYVAMSPCVILVAGIAVASIPGRKNVSESFLQETVRVKLNCARRTSSASHEDNEVDHAVCLKAEFQMHTYLSNENGKFYTTMIYPCFSRLVCFSMGSLTSWRFGLCSSGSSLKSQWHDTGLMRKFQMWHHRCKQIDLHWIQGCQMHFWRMWSTISWKYFIIYQFQLFSTANI